MYSFIKKFKKAAWNKTQAAFLMFESTIKCTNDQMFSIRIKFDQENSINFKSSNSTGYI